MSGRGKGRKKYGQGSYHLKKKDPSEIDFSDWGNPWTFSNLCLSGDDHLIPWLQRNGLLAERLQCEKCGKTAVLNKREKSPDGLSFRCPSGHEFSLRKNSFFQGSSYNFRDLMLFVRCYLNGENLHQCSLSSGMEYKSTSVHWASYIRELFVEYVYRNMFDMTFSGEVEIDESIFGRKVKYNKGKPVGHRIWIFGIVERSTNKIILYPVDNRDAATLVPIIRKHVEPGTTIFSDTWAAYLHLNKMGYTHFSVTHKSTFKQSYKNIETGEIVHCSTNRIEGAWKICKDHFRRINGSNTKMFEQRLSEIIWRNHIHRNGNTYESFFSLLKEVFPLNAGPQYTYPTALFKTWTPPSVDTEKKHHVTIVQESDNESDGESSDVLTPNTPTTIPTERDDRPSASAPDSGSQAVGGSDLPSTSSNSKNGDKRLGKHQTALKTYRRGLCTQNTSDSDLPCSNPGNVPCSDSDTDDDWKQAKLFFPEGFRPLKTSSHKKNKPKPSKRNPYSKSAFVYHLSSDSDFQK